MPERYGRYRRWFLLCGTDKNYRMPCRTHHTDTAINTLLNADTGVYRFLYTAIDKIFYITYTGSMSGKNINIFGTFIQQQRTKRNMTQEYLASELGISRPTYLQIERGNRELTISEAKKVAALLTCHWRHLLPAKNPNERWRLKKIRKEIKRSKHPCYRKKLDTFKQVLLYVLNEVGSKSNVGETVLHKLLYFIDFDYYEKFEETLMGATYIKNHHGPTSVELSTIMKKCRKKENWKR